MKPKSMFISFYCSFSYLFGIYFSVASADNFALLSGTLRTFQSHACDGNELRLSCTPNTVISINFVQYGRFGATERLCPREDSAFTNRGSGSTCLSNNALKVIEKKCRGQRLCRLLASPETFREDPCPNEQKLAEVAYKCKPDNFTNKIVCEGQRMRLSCGGGLRLSIYSATFGSTNSEVLQCPQSDGALHEECQASYATETVMSICAGQAKCSISADNQTFGSLSCSTNRSKHLKVTYVCVSEEVLKRFPPDDTDGSIQVLTTSYPAWASGVDQSVLPNHRPRDWLTKATTDPSHTFKLEMQSDEVPTDDSNGSRFRNQKFVGFMSEWISAHKYVTGNQDKLILYTAVSVGVGLLIFVTVLAVRLIVIRSASRRSSKLELSAPTEDQFFSDSDLEHYEPDKSAGDIQVATTSYTSTLRRHDSDAQPRTPVNATGAELNHYFS